MKSALLGIGGLCACGAWYFSDAPDFDRVVISVGRDVQPLSVVLNYRRGLSIGPVRTAG